MEIKPGMYVRTRYGIRKIYSINPNATRWKYLCKRKEQDGDGCIDLFELCDDDIFGEPSYDFTDLIEKDDYINGNKVVHIIPADICGDEELNKEKISKIEEVYTKNLKNLQNLKKELED